MKDARGAVWREREKENGEGEERDGEEMVRGGGDDGQRGERKRCNLMK